MGHSNYGTISDHSDGWAEQLRTDRQVRRMRLASGHSSSGHTDMDRTWTRQKMQKIWEDNIPNIP